MNGFNKCEICANQIPRLWRFCSKECKNAGTRFAKGKTPWNKGMIGYMKGKKLSHEIKRKIGESNRILHKDNVTPIKNLIRSQMMYKEWRVKVYEKDNYTCQACLERSSIGNRKTLNAHHIKHFSDIIREYSIDTIQKAQKCQLLWDIDNGITLCNICHKLAHTGLTEVKKNGIVEIWNKKS